MIEPTKLSKKEILSLLELLNSELATVAAQGEVYLVGGAVMCLALNARAATRDVAAWFEPARVVREAAASSTISSSSRT